MVYSRAQINNNNTHNSTTITPRDGSCIELSKINHNGAKCEEKKKYVQGNNVVPVQYVGSRDRGSYTSISPCPGNPVPVTWREEIRPLRETTLGAP